MDTIPKPEARLTGPGTLQCKSPCRRGWRRERSQGWMQGQHGTSLLWFLLLVLYGIAFLWLLNFRLARGISRRESQRIGRTQNFDRRSSRAPSRLECGGTVRAGRRRLRKRVALSQPQRAHDIHPGCALVHAPGLSKFRTRRRPVRPCPRLTFPLGAAYSLLLLTNLSYNNFGV